MRLFTAVRLDEGIRGALAEAQDDLLRRGVRGSPVPRENLHMTLAFIGEQPDPDRVLEAMGNVRFSAFPIMLNGIGLFRGSVLWAGVHESEPLRQTVRHLRQELAGADIPFDRKAFMPHITLFRKAEGCGSIPETHVQDISMTVGSISLFRSDRGRSGMIYTEIGRISAND